MKKHYVPGFKKAVLTLYRSHLPKIVLLFYSLFFLLLCQAQGQEYASSKTSENEFAPVGALWHYSQWAFGDAAVTYKTIESVAEVSIQGKLCKHLVQVDRFYADTMLVIDHYMYSDEGHVYFYAEDEFHLLYDFSAIGGDTLVLDYYQTFTGDPLLMIIDSTENIDISGEPRTIQYVTSGDGMMVEFANEVIEGIGGTYFLFPNYDGSSNGALRCYQDPEMDVWLSPYYPGGSWNHVDCDQIITGVDEPISTLGIVIYPNPTNTGMIAIGNISYPSQYRLFTIYGNLIRSGIITPEVNQIHVDELSTGCYVLEIEDSKGIFNNSIFKFFVIND
jgi:hypothetical protein